MVNHRPVLALILRAASVSSVVSLARNYRGPSGSPSGIASPSFRGSDAP